MKGTIAKCLAELVCEKFGRERWENALERAGLSRNTTFMPIQDIDDKAVMTVIECVCKELDISMLQAADAFGDYWVNVYAPKLYGAYFNRAKTAKDLLLKLDGIHETMTKNMANARPPRFEYEHVDDKTIIMKYKSDRGLIDFLVSLVKGVGRYFKEDITVTKLSSDKIKVIFSK